MSDNKNYYYLKLKDNYFDKDNIKILEAMPNGHIYSLIIIKLYLKSCKHDGCLMMTDRIPYDPDKIDILAKVINHDIDHIKKAIQAAVELDLITIFDTGKMWMTEIQNYIGQSSTEADRKRAYRKKLESTEVIVTDNKDTGQKSGQKTGQTDLELERELEREKKKDNIKEANRPYLPLSELLYTEHLKSDPQYKPGRDLDVVFNRWANDIRLLITVDGRDRQSVEDVILWCKTPGNFWVPNIMSGKKLRLKFPTLWLQYQQSLKKVEEEEEDGIDPLFQEYLDACEAENDNR